MTDRRLIPDPALVSHSLPTQITVPYTDLLRHPDGPRDRQLIFGDTVTALGEHSGLMYVQADKDGYCGFVKTTALGERTTATHKITARASHAYSAPDIKSPERARLTFGTRLTAISETSGFIETTLGYVPRQHVHRAEDHATDPASVAELFEHAPYLWGGNTDTGIDCSGLIQAALLACAIPCPGDSDLQRVDLGHDLARDTPPERNDLFFWAGHVALITNANTLIHANAGHMKTTLEPIQDALDRIDRQGGGPLLAHKRF